MSDLSFQYSGNLYSAICVFVMLLAFARLLLVQFLAEDSSVDNITRGGGATVDGSTINVLHFFCTWVVWNFVRDPVVKGSMKSCVLSISNYLKFII